MIDPPLIIWHMFDKVFRRWNVFIIGPFGEFEKLMADWGYKYVDELFEAKGMCIEFNGSNNTEHAYYNVVWMEKFEASTLVHELSHLVMYCFKQVQVPIDTENTETFAFYFEYWHTEFLKARRNFPDGIRASQVKKLLK